MTTDRVRAIALRHLFVLKQKPLRIAGLFYSALVGLFVWGVISSYLTNTNSAHFNFVVVLLGTVTLWHFFAHVHQGITLPFLEDMRTMNFSNLFASPLSITEYGLGLITNSVFSSSITLCLLALSAYILFSYNIFQFGLLLVPLVGVLFLFATGLGIFTIAMILRLGPSIEALASSLPLFILPFSSVFHPISALPHYVRWIAYLLPSAHIFESMREVTTSGFFDVKRFLLALILSLLYLIFSFWFFSYSYKKTLQQGLFKKFLID